MRTILGLILLISSSWTTVASARPNLTYETEKGRFQLVCDSTGKATFTQRGQTPNGPLCIMMKETGVAYVMSKPNPCDNSNDGRALREILGPLCDAPKSLIVKDQYFTLTRICDFSEFANALAAYMPRSKCIMSYEEWLPEGMHRCSDGKIRGPHEKKNSRVRATTADHDDE